METSVGSKVLNVTSPGDEDITLDISILDNDPFNNAILEDNVVALTNEIDSKKININANYKGIAPLITLAIFNNKPKVIEYLLSRKEIDTNISSTYWNNSTPLHIAADQLNLELLKSLFDKGANPNNLDSYKNTPLHIVSLQCEKGKIIFPFVKLLLDNGADPGIRNNDDKTPSDILSLCTSTVDRLDTSSSIRFLNKSSTAGAGVKKGGRAPRKSRTKRSHKKSRRRSKKQLSKK